MEKKLLRAASIQSIGLLLICLFIAITFKGDKPETVMANIIGTNTKVEKASHPNYTYVIDAGHGGIDSGTMSADSKYQEKKINLAIAYMVKHQLEKEDNVKVYMTREDDCFLTPEQRIEYINNINPKMVISIHCNSADNVKATGVEVLYCTNNEESKILSEACLNGIIESTEQVNRGILKGDNIYIIRNAKVPIALVETGFLSNENELSFLLNRENQKKIAGGIVNGIKNCRKELNSR